MTVFVIVGSLILLALAVLAVAWPLLRERREPEVVQEVVVEIAAVADPLVELEERRDSIYQAIKELQFDYEVGKVSEADYLAFDSQFKAQAVTVLKQIDELTTVDPELDAQIEAEIAALRRNGRVPSAAAEPAAVQPAAAQFCPQCGHKVQPGDRFCGKCGMAMH